MEDTPTGRLDWIDTARGAAIALVVLLHTREWHYAEFDYHFPGRAFWDTFIAFAGTVRMPLFFMVSGLLAVSSLSRPLASGGARKPQVIVHLYLLWLGIYTVVFAILPTDGQVRSVDGPLDALSQIVVPDTALWYLWALVVYYLALRACARLPQRIVLAVAAMLSIVGTAVTGLEAHGFLASVMKNFLYFALGAYYAGHWKAVAATATWTRLGVFGGVYLILTAALLSNGAHPVVHWAGVDQLTGIVAIHTGVLGSSLLARSRRLSSPFRFLGGRTLPIFVLQALLIGFVNALAAGPLVDALPSLLGSPAAGLLYPPVLALVVLALSVAVGEGAKRVHLGWLFDLPRWRRVAASA